MEQIPWFQRRFRFDEDQNIFPSILERLAGTPARLEEKVRDLPPAMLTHKVGDTWSIKEHLGHLSDLEPLWQGRLQDITRGEVVMREADLQNTKTHEANHNAKTLKELLSTFRSIRQKTLAMLEDMDEATVFKSALHPRLNTPMRTMDLFIFVAEHDDHHLVKITELSRSHKNFR